MRICSVQDYKLTYVYVAIATKPVYRLQIRSILHNPSAIPPSYIRVRAVVWECGEGQTDTQTAVTNIHFASAMPHAKCNYVDDAVRLCTSHTAPLQHS